MRNRSGFSLLEMMVALAIIGVFALCAAPAFATYRRRASMTSQVVELQGIFRSLRMRAIATNHNAGVKFIPAGNQWAYSLYEDGDGDGIRSDDIASGVDRRFAGPSVLTPQFNIASIALLPDAIRDPDGDPLAPNASAVQFNRSTICSFSPTGSATPGTIYITDGAGELIAVRVSGASGRVRTLRYNSGNRRWVQQ
jgi:prepilin-type N-terminal cleavage/methylation domain-containing protein